MKITVTHPGLDSGKVVEQCISSKQEIKRSPHIGNVNRSELTLIAGLASLGANLQLELVDTIQGHDTYSVPRSIQRSNEASVTLVSKRKSSGFVVGSCVVGSDAVLETKKLGVGSNITEGDSLVDIHLRSLEAVLPQAISARLSSEFFAALGQPLLAGCLEQAQALLSRPLRRVDADGKIRVHEGPVNEEDLFGTGEHTLQGVLPPLEAMMAIEITQQAIAAQGADSQVVHIAGPDMIQYTKDLELMKLSSMLAQSVCAEAGVAPSVKIDYVVPDMKVLIASGSFPKLIGQNVCSQYDLLESETI